eukprot:gene13007-3506_t
MAIQGSKVARNKQGCQQSMGTQDAWIQSMLMQGSKTQAGCASMGRARILDRHADASTIKKASKDSSSWTKGCLDPRAMRMPGSNKQQGCKKEARMPHQWGRKDAWIQSHADARLARKSKVQHQWDARSVDPEPCDAGGSKKSKKQARMQNQMDARSLGIPSHADAR